MENVLQKLLEEVKVLRSQLDEARKTDPYQSQEIKELTTALSKAQGEYPAIGADRENPFFKSNYADLNIIMRALRPTLAKNGLSLTQDTRIDVHGMTILHTRLWHSTGQWIESRAKIVPVKNDPQSYGSALTYSKRYSAMALLGVTVDKDPSDDDAERAMPDYRSSSYNHAPVKQQEPSITKEQLDILEGELQDQPNLAELVLNKLQIDTLAAMPKSKFASSLTRIREIKKSEGIK